MSLGLSSSSAEKKNISNLGISSINSTRLSLESRPPVPGSESTDDRLETTVDHSRIHMGQEATLKPSPSPWEGVPVKVRTKKYFTVTNSKLFHFNAKIFDNGFHKNISL